MENQCQWQEGSIHSISTKLNPRKFQIKFQLLPSFRAILEKEKTEVNTNLNFDQLDIQASIDSRGIAHLTSKLHRSL